MVPTKRNFKCFDADNKLNRTYHIFAQNVVDLSAYFIKDLSGKLAF